MVKKEEENPQPPMSPRHRATRVHSRHQARFAARQRGVLRAMSVDCYDSVTKVEACQFVFV